MQTPSVVMDALSEPNTPSVTGKDSIAGDGKQHPTREVTGSTGPGCVWLQFYYLSFSVETSQ